MMMMKKQSIVVFYGKDDCTQSFIVSVDLPVTNDCAHIFEHPDLTQRVVDAMLTIVKGSTSKFVCQPENDALRQKVTCCAHGCQGQGVGHVLCAVMHRKGNGFVCSFLTAIRCNDDMCSATIFARLKQLGLLYHDGKIKGKIIELPFKKDV